MRNRKLERWWDPLSGICLILLVFLSAYALETTGWTKDLNHVTASALIGVIIGSLIGFSAFKKITAMWLVGLYAVAIYLWQIVFSLGGKVFWSDRLVEYLDRIRTTFNHLIQNTPVEDGILFLSIVTWIFIVISLTMGFSFTRNRKGWLQLFTLVLLFITTNFYLPSYRRNFLFSGFYIVFLFIFLGRQYYLSQKADWQEAGIKEDHTFSSFSLRVVLLIVFIIGVFSWGLNSVIIEYFPIRRTDNSEYWNRYSSSWELIQNFFFPLSRQSGFGEGYFPNSLPLGTSRSLKEDPVFSVGFPDDFEYKGPFYWKGRVFKDYKENLWSNEKAFYTHTSRVKLNPYLPENPEIGKFIFTYKYPRENIFTPQIIQEIDRETQYLFYKAEDGKQDIISLSDYQIIRRGDQIEISGGYVITDERDLKNSGNSYPDWIKSQYLALSEDLNIDIQALAKEITENKISNFEKALAITNFLRMNFTYSDEVIIPKDMNPIDWFLFSGREGFCNYYASANVIMLRTIGIPARLVIGYADGELSRESSTYTVRINDNHAWVEVYFPGIGWVIFEPTPSRPVINYEQPDENLDLTQLSREERILFENQQFEMDISEFEELKKIAEKYDSGENELAEVLTKRSILPASIFAGGIIFAGVVFWLTTFNVRKKTIQFPGTIREYLKKRGIRSPKWITKWAVYEEHTPEERSYRKLKRISGLIISAYENSETPGEFFSRLLGELDDLEIVVKNFDKLYQRSIYREIRSGDIKDLEKAYLSLVSQIILEKIKRIGRLIIKSNFSKKSLG
jgi:transglutaminase-like putative cysteine protease